MKFNIDIKQIKIGASEESVSKTIEELLSLNDKIPSHTKEEITDLTEVQLEKGKYENKSYRGEQEEVIERQFSDRSDGEMTITEVQMGNIGEQNNGHNPEKSGDAQYKNFKNISPIWKQVHDQEDARSNTPMEKRK